MNGISVIICCYNSAARLPETLRHLACQRYDKRIATELILVNNNSTDETVETALSEWSKYKSDTAMLVVDQSIPGLTHAREKGVRSAQYDYIIFCDDDNWLCPEYLQVAFTVMEQNPRAGALGGKSSGVAEIPFPAWWEDYKNGYAVGDQAAADGDVSARGYLWGAGLIARRNLLTKIFDEKTPMLLADRRGQALTSGGDAEICCRVLLLGYRLYYDRRLFYSHFISKERLTSSYKTKLFDSFVVSSTALAPYTFVIESLAVPYRQRIRRSAKLMLKAMLLPFGLFRPQEASIYNSLSVFLKQPWLAKNLEIRSILRFVNNH